MRHVRCAPALIAAALLAGCNADVPGATTRPVSASSGTLDCGPLMQMSPEQALTELGMNGYEVVWRFDHTEAAGEIVSDAPRDVPDGVIGDVIVTGRTATVFVSPPGDALHDSYPEEPTCIAGG